MWLDEWFRNYIQPSSKIKTCERYSEIIEKHLKVKLGEYELDELTPLVLQRYVTGLMQSGNIVTGKGLAANSVNGIITVIQNSLKLAYTLGELKEYTADKIKRPKTKEKEVSCFSLAEQKKIEQAALSSKKRKFIGIDGIANTHRYTRCGNQIGRICQDFLNIRQKCAGSFIQQMQ